MFWTIVFGIIVGGISLIAILSLFAHEGFRAWASVIVIGAVVLGLLTGTIFLAILFKIYPVIWMFILGAGYIGWEALRKKMGFKDTIWDKKDNQE